MQRSGTRGVNSDLSNNGIATGPLLAQKNVSIINKAAKPAQHEEQNGPPAFKSGKIKLDRLKKEPESPKKAKLSIIEVNNRNSPDKGE